MLCFVLELDTPLAGQRGGRSRPSTMGLPSWCASADGNRDGVYLSTKGYAVLWTAFDQLVHTKLKGRGLEWNNQQDLPWTLPAYVVVCSASSSS